MPKKRENFCQLNITAAVNAVLNDGLSKKAAAKKFGISRSTLQFRLKNLNGKTSCGPATVLSDKEEELLQTWIIESCKKGFPRRKEDLQMSVKQFLDVNNRLTPFKNNMPGNGWYRAFMQRHPLISIRTSERVTTASACVSEKDIKKWFSDIHQYLVDEKLDDILQDPTRLFNGDETGFSLCPKTKSVLAPKGAKDIYEVAVGNAKENLTVMFTFNAAGDMCHPMVIYNYQRIPQDIVNSVPPNWGIGHSESGWMKSEVFYEFIANIFYPFVVEKGITFPIILFVDGHKSHLTYQLSELCTSFNIILIALYPNSTRILQPADVAAFRPLKSGWKKGVFEWRKDNNLSTAVTKKDFAPILKKVIDETVKAETLINGFKACGFEEFHALYKLYQLLKSNDKNMLNSGVKCISEADEQNLLDFIEDQNEVTIVDDSFFDSSKGVFQDVIEQNKMDVCVEANKEKTDFICNEIENTRKQDEIEISIEKNVVTPRHLNGKTFQISPLESCLVWPVTPERKGKRNIERVPYVVSSKMWKSMNQSKEDKKKQIELEKENRKKHRIHNRLVKSNLVNDKKLKTVTKSKVVRNIFQKDIVYKKKPSETVTSGVLAESLCDDIAPNIVEEIDNDIPTTYVTVGLCFGCGRNLSELLKGVDCAFCSHMYHLKCLTTDEFCDMGENEPILFICKICQKDL
ncbi:uncharacterized protein LOC112602107, partial [Melanaphis sacchari]|uniref:uncharacterized protein LOC112602107 n=1 Tax=Melanaphis sacchari TaxID=742174 RepID=UPI000DC14898